MDVATNLQAFFIGGATAYFICLAYNILKGRDKAYTRLHKVLGYIFAYLAISNMKDLVLTFPGMYTQSVLDTILIWDGWGALTFLIFLFELTMPGWTTIRRLAIMAIPFCAFTAAYIINPTHGVIMPYTRFLCLFGLIIMVTGYYRSRHYLNYIRNNYSNIDEIDISWIGHFYILAFISQLFWFLTSMITQQLADCIYYFFEVMMWQLVYTHCRYLKTVVPVSDDTANANESTRHAAIEHSYPFAGSLERIIEEEKLYLNPNLSLADLTSRLGTNRTYISQYFTNIKRMTFYDYINAIRIEKESVPLLENHPEYTLDYIAQKSGFNSLSTFRRAFKKFTGKTPGNYRCNC